MESEHSFIGPEPACDISARVAKKAIRNRMNRDHNKTPESITGLKNTKGLPQGPSAKRTPEPL
jgi:hypothetical protein